jgi:predicted ArsR family transcriptional regulator
MVSDIHLAEALRHPVRVLILRLLLASKTVTTPAVAASLPGVSRTNVRHHMEVLVKLGLIEFAGQSKHHGRGKRSYEYRLLADVNQVRGSLWATRARLLTHGRQLDGTAILDPVAMSKFERLKAMFLFRLAELERETRERQTPDDAPATTSFAILIATDI